MVNTIVPKNNNLLAQPRLVSIAHIQRSRMPGNHSIERLFQSIRHAMLPEWNIEAHECPDRSLGVRSRLRGVFWAYRSERDINHITGDVHYLALGLTGLSILTIHDCVSLGRLKGWRKWLFWLLWYYFPALRAKVITVVSDASRQELEKYLPLKPNNICVIHNCLTGTFPVSRRPFDRVRPTLLFIGTRPNKNLARVCDALEDIPCRLRIIGVLSTAQTCRLRDRGIEFSSENCLSDSEIITEYDKCDIVLFPSLYEGFGLPILEANASGKPVITSSVCSMPEVAADAAIYVDPLDSSSIRAAVLRVINDDQLRTTLVANGLRNVARFSPSSVATKYATLYHSAWRHFQGRVL
jgi:glycosyltransferase involved in cell wall biosynthesis